MLLLHCCCAATHWCTMTSITSPFLASCAQMIVWSHSTARGDPTSPSSPTPPVGQPEQPAPQASPSPPTHPTRLHSQRSPSIICRFRWWNLPFNNLQVVFSKEEIWRKINNCGRSVSPPFEDWPQNASTLTLHFLVIILYTEQASIHHNDCGKCRYVMHKWGHWYEFWKGMFL